MKAGLDALFLDGLKSPIVVSRQNNENTIELVLDMLKSLNCFNGHFDDFPVVPGVALIEWAIRSADSRFIKGFVFDGMSQIKFQKFIRPNQIVRLRLIFNPESMNLKYQYHSGDTIYSSGILKFRNK